MSSLRMRFAIAVSVFCAAAVAVSAATASAAVASPQPITLSAPAVVFAGSDGQAVINTTINNNTTTSWWCTLTITGGTLNGYVAFDGSVAPNSATTSTSTPAVKKNDKFDFQLTCFRVDQTVNAEQIVNVKLR